MIKIKQHVQLTLVCILLASCSANVPIKEKARYSYNGSYAMAVQSMTKLTTKCWNHKEKAFKHDHIYPVSTINNDAQTIVIGHEASDISYSPFAKVIIKKNQLGKPQIIVKEGRSLHGVSYKVNSGVASWLSGNTSCKPLEYNGASAFSL